MQAYSREEGLRPLEAELVAEFFPAPPARILDLGCGAGRTSMGLNRLGYDVVAIDLSTGLLAEARRRYHGIDFREMDATQLGFERETFDAAMFSYNGIDCIYPVEERVRCLQEVGRVLRPGAPFIFSSHNYQGAVFSGGFFYLLGYLNAVRFCLEQRGNPHRREWYLRYPDPGGDQHLYSAPPDRTARQLRQAGLEILALIGHQRRLPAWKVRWNSQHVHFVARRPKAGVTPAARQRPRRAQ
jgi:SAM-dependent methyltransferase